MEDDQREGDHGQAQVVVVDGVEERNLQAADLDVGNRGNELDALRPTEGLAEPFPAQPDDLAGREGPDEKVERLHPEQGKAQDPGDQGGGNGAQQHRRRNRDAQTLRQQRTRIGADPHEHRVCKRPLTGEGQQPVAHHHQDVDDQEDRDLFLGEAEQVGHRDEGPRRSPRASPGTSSRDVRAAREARRLRPVPGPRTDPSAAR